MPPRLCEYYYEKPFPLKLNYKYFTGPTVKLRQTLYKNNAPVTGTLRWSFSGPEKPHRSYTNCACSLF
jgi:hypothetical protein